MKNPEQIKAWLEARPWYEQFENNVMRDWSNTSKGIKRTLSGENGITTIALAFNWQLTDEGFEFWKAIDEQFRKWYDDENPD